MNAKKALLQSVDGKIYKRNLIVFVCVYLGFELFGVLFGNLWFKDYPEAMAAFIWASTFWYASVFGPFIIYYAWKLCSLANCTETCTFGEYTLSESGRARGHQFFGVELVTAESVINAYTRPIYSESSTIANYEYWKNKKAIVAYDKKSEIAIVIGEATEELRQLLQSH